MNTTTKRPTEAMVSAGLSKTGMGYLIVSRFKSNGLVETGVFLLDVYCLGVKDAFFVRIGLSQYQDDFLPKMASRGPLNSLEPACARKLVEEAVRYASNLGFAPHSDYRKACRVFGGISPETCLTQFTFGQDGKPCFIQGPKDSEERCHQVLNLLRSRCGEGNYHFMLVSGPLGDLYKEEGDTAE